MATLLLVNCLGELHYLRLIQAPGYCAFSNYSSSTNPTSVFTRRQTILEGVSAEHLLPRTRPKKIYCFYFTNIIVTNS